MNNFFIVIPTFNDWKSLNKLLFSINKILKELEENLELLLLTIILRKKLN